MADGETRDFMSVDSFSQLPFMRRDNPPNPPIRLFGFDFPPNSSAAVSDSPNTTDVDPGEALKKFECNYCYRNFPTSQALGGHQNAHKRERQNAKRANLAASAGGHLQSLLGYGVPPRSYPFWSFSTGGSGVRFYGGMGSVAQPIDGNPMSGIWRAAPPTAMHHRRDHFTAGALPPSLSLLSVGQERRTTAPAPQDAVSLDLHL